MFLGKFGRDSPAIILSLYNLHDYAKGWLIVPNRLNGRSFFFICSFVISRKILEIQV